MPGALVETVNAYFDLTAQGGDFFTLDDPVKGVLDNVTYTLAGDVATDISNHIRSVQIGRGRSNALEEFNVGVAQCVANNHDRTFDPEYAAGPYFGNIRPGKRVTFATNGITTFDGLIDDWDYDYPISTDSTATFDVADVLASLGSKQFDEWISTPGQTVGARLHSILDRTEVQFAGGRDFDVGTSTLQDDLITWGSNVLNYAQLCVKADLGRLFASRDGVLTFQGRDGPVTGVGGPVFRDDGSGIQYSAISVDFGTELLFNRVSVDATGFDKQTVVNQTSIDLYGVRSLSISQLPLETVGQASTLANILLNQYSMPVSRIASITVNLHGLESADQGAVLSMDLGSVVRVVYSPNSISPALDQFCMVEGISHLIGNKFHQVSLNLTRLATGFDGVLFTLDDATLGKLDSGNQLAF